MATQELKKLLAIQAASGHSVAELAKLHDYSYNGMTKLLATDELKQLIRDHQEYLMETATRIYFRMAQHGETLTDGMINDALNDDHPKQFEARRYILDKLTASRTSGSTDVNVNFSIAGEVVRELASTLSRIQEVKGAYRSVSAVDSPHLIDGKAAIPDIEASAVDGGPPPNPGDPNRGGRPYSPIGANGPGHLVDTFGKGPNGEAKDNA